MPGPYLPREPLDGFTNNLNLPNDPILEQGILAEDLLILAMQIHFHLCYGIQNVS